jgi:sulfoxide reductase heme-binding subunit YedZ
MGFGRRYPGGRLRRIRRRPPLVSQALSQGWLRVRHVLAKVLNHPWFFWVILSLPAIPMVAGLAAGSATPEGLLHGTGEFAGRFLILAMMVTPLALLFHHARWTRWLMRRRRALGVAAFGYAAFHTLLYVVDMGSLQLMLDEFWALGIWTGWAAFAIFIPLAVTSNDRAVRRLKRAWQPLHRWVYPAALLTLVHWIFVHNNLVPALVHFAPLAALQIYRLVWLWRRCAAPGARPAA